MSDKYSNKSVLLVDDSLTIRQILSNGLKEMGFEQSNLREAKDGRAALALVEKMKFDLIISDWNMPGMDGLAFLKSMKGDAQLKKIPFLMITSETDKEKEKEAFHSGADQYITKPFKMTILEKTISQLIIKPVIFEEKKVLVVEDSLPMRSILKKNLNQAGFAEENIYEADNGDDAIALMSSDTFDLVLTDWHMPKMNGLDFMRKVKAQKGFKHIPFIMVTGESDKGKIVEAVKGGACEYIIKPFKAVELQDKIKSVF